MKHKFQVSFFFTCILQTTKIITRVSLISFFFGFRQNKTLTHCKSESNNHVFFSHISKLKLKISHSLFQQRRLSALGKQEVVFKKKDLQPVKNSDAFH